MNSKTSRTDALVVVIITFQKNFFDYFTVLLSLFCSAGTWQLLTDFVRSRIVLYTRPFAASNDDQENQGMKNQGNILISAVRDECGDPIQYH